MNQNGNFLQSLAEKTDTLIKQTKANVQETLEFILTNPMEGIYFKVLFISEFN